MARAPTSEQTDRQTDTRVRSLQPAAVLPCLGGVDNAHGHACMAKGLTVPELDTACELRKQPLRSGLGERLHVWLDLQADVVEQFAALA